MSIFNSKTPVTKIPIVESLDIGLDSYSFVKDIEEEGFNISVEFNKTAYVGLKENNYDILEEGFSEFFKDAAEWFKKIAHKIVEFTKNAMKYFVSYFQDFSKFLEKNEDYLKSLDIAFTYKGYEYNFPKNTPVLTKVHDIIGSYNIEINRINDMKYADITKLRNEFANETYKNKLRANILGDGSNEVTADNFSKASKRLFRSTDEKINININNSYISNIIKDYSKMKALLNETETNKAKIVRMLNDLEVFFQKKASVVYNNTVKEIQTTSLRDDEDKLSRGDTYSAAYDENKLKNLNIYFDLKYREAKLVSNCVITIYIDKVNAIKDCMTQYRDIIRSALMKKKESSNSK